MPFNVLQGQKVDVRVWAPLHEVESQALDQLCNVASLGVVHPHGLAAMPDVHLGVGATVGSVVPLVGALIPAAVGSDIACGMGLIKTNLTADDMCGVDLAEVLHSIKRTIPVGFNSYRDPAWIDSSVEGRSLCLLAKLPPTIKDRLQAVSLQLGTLGGGNHFIELEEDREGFVWLMLHSGSRNAGKRLSDTHIAAAKRACKAPLPDRALAWLEEGTPEFGACWEDLAWAGEYADLNRRLMAERVIRELGFYWPGVVTSTEVWCHHNYVAKESHFGQEVYVTRKGAISAREGELGIIPGSMGTSSYLVRGRGNPESYCSASHGAGRKMSRGQAKRTITVEEMDRQMTGIEYEGGAGFLDEAPTAYKDIDRVMANQSDLVEIVEKFHQILVVKG